MRLKPGGMTRSDRGRVYNRDAGTGGSVLLPGVHADHCHHFVGLYHGGLLSGKAGRRDGVAVQWIQRVLEGKATAVSTLRLPSPGILAADHGRLESQRQQNRKPPHV